MSTLKVSTLQNASSATANITLDASGNATVGGTLAMGSSFLRNRLINGDFSVAQRGTSFTSTGSANNDDTYNLDRWYVLSDGNDTVDITQATDVPSNGPKYSIGLDVETINKKFGVAQIVENINCQDLIGNTVSLSFKARVTATTKLDNVKAAIVAWSGTADTVTSDIISAWNVEGTNPTLIANATYENTPANLNVTTSWATYKIENITVDTASTTNIIVFIWSDVTDTTLGDFLYVTDVQIEVGSVATPFERRQYGQELALCERYYYKIVSNTDIPLANAYVASTTSAIAIGQFPVSLRAAPTALEQTGTAANYQVRAQATSTACSAVPAFATATTDVWSVTATVASGLTAGNGGALRGAATGAYLAWSAEL